MMAVPPILVILGPTASGKSELAFALAQRCGAHILSVDSMQVYRGMDIGTAKPSAQERIQVRHHAIDLVEPNETFTVARFVEVADAVIADARGQGVPLIATGGTPLYFKALFEGMFEGPSADAALRDRLRALTNEELHQKLQTVDPAAAGRIHLNDTKRLVRALEVYELTGQPITSLQREWGSDHLRHEAIWIGLDWEREQLNRRINARVKAMMAAGWVEETRELLKEYAELSKTAAEATGYQEILQHLHGKMSLEEATEQIKIATRQLARRQMKWFRRFLNVSWLDGAKPLEEKLEHAMKYWSLT
ncbi:MAG TPA: tRNA (adenosine(37)-N6)-dimethylallyltransferase MiaA [Tepidisphaeraceae bacterium]|jgi:tRNA dimethylallyltransferase